MYSGLINLIFWDRFISMNLSPSPMTILFYTSQMCDVWPPTDFPLSTCTHFPIPEVFHSSLTSETQKRIVQTKTLQFHQSYPFTSPNPPDSLSKTCTSLHCICSIHRTAIYTFLATQPRPHVQDFQPHSHQHPRPFTSLPSVVPTFPIYGLA